MASKPQAMPQGQQLDQSQVRAPPASIQRQPRPQGDLSDSFYFDPKLQPENFKVLNDLNSRETIRTPPQAGKGTYSPGDEVLFRLQSSASFIDRQMTNFKINFENQSQRDSSGDHHYILADGGNVLLDNLEVEIGEQIAEKNEEGARYYQHLLLGTANQGHYDHEANALMKSYKYKSFDKRYQVTTTGIGDANTSASSWSDKDLSSFQGTPSANNTQTMIVHADNLAFFRGSRFMPLFADVVIRLKLPSADKVMLNNPRNAVTGSPDYRIKSIELMTEHVFPQTELLNSVHDKIFRSPSGLSMVLDGAVDVYRRDLANSNENNINIQASYSNIEGIVAMVYKKSRPASEDSINLCPLPSLQEFGITIQTHELGTRGGSFGLEEMYANYRKHYNMLSSIGGQGMLDFNRYSTEHTPLCISTELLPDAPPEILQNALSTNDRGSQLNISLKVGTPSQVNDTRLLVFVVHKRILQLKEGIAKVGI